MNFHCQDFFHRVWPIAGLLALALILAGCGKSEPSNGAAKTNGPAASKTNLVATAQTNSAFTIFDLKSVFDDKLKSGKDPFYPNRALFPLSPTARVQSLPAPPVMVPVLTLKSIFFGAGGRSAMINNQIFAPGQEASVKVINGFVQVRCLEINKRSVTVRIAGEPEDKELQLKEKF